MDHRTENLQYGLHSTLWVLSKEVHAPGVTPPKCIQHHTPGMKAVRIASHYPCQDAVITSTMTTDKKTPVAWTHRHCYRPLF